MRLCVLTQNPSQFSEFRSLFPEADFVPSHTRCDVLVVLPDGNDLPEEAVGIAVLPPGANVTAKQAVTYGLSPFCTVTFSGQSDSERLLSIQREIVTIGGEIVEQQEIPLPAMYDPDFALCVAAVMLVTGRRTLTLAEISCKACEG